MKKSALLSINSLRKEKRERMEMKEYVEKLKKEMKKMDKKAKNPFLEHNFAYNPFMSAIEQTYIWVERTKH